MIQAKVKIKNGGTATLHAGRLIELIRSLDGLQIEALETCEIKPDEIQPGRCTTAEELKRRAGE